MTLHQEARRERDRRRYRTSVETRIARARSRTPETYKRYRERHPEKIRAHKAVRDALRRGELVRLPCEVCGEVRSQAHHHDYAKPTEVQWLCSLHHKELHRKLEAAG